MLFSGGLGLSRGRYIIKKDAIVNLFDGRVSARFSSGRVKIKPHFFEKESEILFPKWDKHFRT